MSATSSDHQQEPPRLPPPSELDKWRAKLGSQLNSVVNLISAIRQPIPDQTDGGKPLDPEEERYWVKKLESDLGDLGHLGITDVKTLIEMGVRMKNGEMIDDKMYLMEGLVKVGFASKKLFFYFFNLFVHFQPLEC